MINQPFWLYALFAIYLASSCCEAKEWQRLYLASYPQSGNHWVRYLVEEASHIATSSVYVDFEPPGHMKKVFPWGGYCCDHGYQGECRYPKRSERVLLKTHYPYPHKDSPYDRKPYVKALRIVRNPIDSFYSRYAKLPKGPLQETVPSSRVRELIKTWKAFQLYWNQQEGVVTLRYEDILADPRAALREICALLRYKVSEEDIERAVLKHPPEGVEWKHLGKFKKSDLKIIHRELEGLMQQFNYHMPALEINE